MNTDIENNRYNFRLRPSAVQNTGTVTRTGEASDKIPATARPRRGHAQSTGPLGSTSAPAEGKALAALADTKGFASAETSITNISDTSFQMTSEEMLERIKTESSTSDSDTLDGYNINREIPIPTSAMNNLQDRMGVTQERPRRWAEAEGTHNGGEGSPLKKVEPKTGPEAPAEEQRSDNRTTHRDKGKGPDPLEWGAVQLLEDEVDAEIQGQIIQAYSIRRDKPSTPLEPDPESTEQDKE
ncbi:hypothetical protein C0989_004215 [Termitomyces sp. Mn162]|nr:hypothetical protein C0989_004215 [Termitomyces sp. Mn162]